MTSILKSLLPSIDNTQLETTEREIHNEFEGMTRKSARLRTRTTSSSSSQITEESKISSDELDDGMETCTVKKKRDKTKDKKKKKPKHKKSKNTN